MLEDDRRHARGINFTERLAAFDSHTDRVIEHERFRIDASIECDRLLQSLKKRIKEIVGCSSQQRNFGDMISPNRLVRSQCSCGTGIGHAPTSHIGVEPDNGGWSILQPTIGQPLDDSVVAMANLRVATLGIGQIVVPTPAGS